jgi:hypothetical protein
MLCWTLQSFDKLHNRGHTMYNFKAVLPSACAYYCHLPHKVYFCIQTYITLQLHTPRLANFGFDFRTRSIRMRRLREKWLTIIQPRHAICRNCSRFKICTQWPSFHKLRVQECLCNEGWHPFDIKLSSLFTSLDEGAASLSMSNGIVSAHGVCVGFRRQCLFSHAYSWC